MQTDRELNDSLHASLTCRIEQLQRGQYVDVQGEESRYLPQQLKGLAEFVAARFEAMPVKIKNVDSLTADFILNALKNQSSLGKVSGWKKTTRLKVMAVLRLLYIGIEPAEGAAEHISADYEDSDSQVLFVAMQLSVRLISIAPGVIRAG